MLAEPEDNGDGVDRDRVETEMEPVSGHQGHWCHSGGAELAAAGDGDMAKSAMGPAVRQGVPKDSDQLRQTRSLPPKLQ